MTAGAARGFGKDYAVRAAAAGSVQCPPTLLRPAEQLGVGSQQHKLSLHSAKLVIGDLSQSDIDLVVSEIQAEGGSVEESLHSLWALVVRPGALCVGSHQARATRTRR